MCLSKIKFLNTKFVVQLIVLHLFMYVSCSKNNTAFVKSRKEITIEKENIIQIKQHEYAGWYCPDNLNNFPAVDINKWKSVPVVNGRLPTKEETQNGTSLIFVDAKKYPDAKALNTKLPKLARFYSTNTKKKELVVVIQTLSILKDSIVGFRYLNGGNGSAQLNEVEFLSDIEIENLLSSHFVALKIKINASQNKIWDVITKPKFRNILQPKLNNNLTIDWNNYPKVNLKSINGGVITSEFSEKLYGNYYIQIDYVLNKHQYVEKFLLLENKQTKSTELQIVCGPYLDDFKNQKSTLNNWAQKVKELSEKNNKK